VLYQGILYGCPDEAPSRSRGNLSRALYGVGNAVSSSDSAVALDLIGKAVGIDHDTFVETPELWCAFLRGVWLIFGVRLLTRRRLTSNIRLSFVFHAPSNIPDRKTPRDFTPRVFPMLEVAVHSKHLFSTVISSKESSKSRTIINNTKSSNSNSSYSSSRSFLRLDLASRPSIPPSIKRREAAARNMDNMFL